MLRSLPRVVERTLPVDRIPLSVAGRAARLAGSFSRLALRRGGTSYPGRLLLQLRPGALRELTAGIGTRITISATNGKTTTARLLSDTLRADGYVVVANTAGANLASGVATALLDGPNGPDAAVLEVDEAHLPRIVSETQPQVIVLGNLYRDQLDRYGELETLASVWADMLATLRAGTIVVACADDPAVACVAAAHRDTVFFGIEDRSVAVPLSHAADSITCRRCGNALVYEGATVAHLGWWSCECCGLQRPSPTVSVHDIAHRPDGGIDATLHTSDGPIALQLGLSGVHNLYNAAAAAAAALACGVKPSVIASAMAATQPAFGRGETVMIDGREVRLSLAKNPTGANENLRTVLRSDGELHVVILLNDRVADGRDVSWIWDVDYELVVDRLASLTVGGERAHDLALRFHYAGLPIERLAVIEDPGAALDHAVAAAPAGGVVHVLPSYTALLDLRAVLAGRGLVDEFWE